MTGRFHGVQNLCETLQDPLRDLRNLCETYAKPPCETIAKPMRNLCETWVLPHPPYPPGFRTPLAGCNPNPEAAPRAPADHPAATHRAAPTPSRKFFTATPQPCGCDRGAVPDFPPRMRTGAVKRSKHLQEMGFCAF